MPTSCEAVLKMSAEAQAQGKGEAWHREVERAAAEVVAAGVRVEATSQESRAAVTALEITIVALEAAKQSARPVPGVKAWPPPPPPSQQLARPASGARARPPPLPPPHSARPASAVKAPPPLPLPPCKCVRLECGNAVTDSESGSMCFLGHNLCAPCTTQHVKEILRSQGTLRWDRIFCLSRECTAYMGGVSVQNCISHGLVQRINAAQLPPSIGSQDKRDLDRGPVGRTAVMRAADIAMADNNRASEATIVELFKPCPQCKVPTEKEGGSDHMTCPMCQHDYYWSCHCVFPTPRHVSCIPR